MGEMNDRVRQYAAGEHSIEKYKKMLGSVDKNTSWVSINWMPSKKSMARMFRKMYMKMKIWKTMQAHKMIQRLK